MKVAGRDVQVDPQTGQIKPLTPAEAQQLADGLKTMLNKSTEGLVPEKHPDGSASIDLQGRFQNVAMARVNADGTLEQSCVDEPLAAAQFFGIDPKSTRCRSAQDHRSLQRCCRSTLQNPSEESTPMSNHILTRLHSLLLILVVAMIASSPAFGNVTITIQNADIGPTGFNDPTPATPGRWQ